MVGTGLHQLLSKLPAFYTTNKELICTVCAVGGQKSRCTGEKDPRSSLLAKVGKETAGWVALTDPEDSREGGRAAAQCCSALLRKWLRLGATNEETRVLCGLTN